MCSEDFFMFNKMKSNYTRKEVQGIISDYEQRLDIQRRDINYLKNDNQELRNSLDQLAGDNSTNPKTNR